MAKKYAFEQNIHFVPDASHALPDDEYEACTINGGQLTGADWSNKTFIQCTFTDCDLSNITLHHTGFQQVRFVRCKMMGLHFDDCNPFLLELAFEHCNLSFSLFSGLKLPKTVFQSCLLEGADFENADLTGSEWPDSDLRDALFENTILEKADFTTAVHFRISPHRNRIKKARFSAQGLIGLLREWDIVVV